MEVNEFYKSDLLKLNSNIRCIEMNTIKQNVNQDTVE